MAERRMFSKTIIDSDVFLDLPLSTQALYFHLAMRADDDGFINNPKRIMRAIGSTDDEMKLLLAKRYLLSFDSGVVVIKHWRMHNYIQKDRYKETVYIEEKSAITVKDNKSYTELDTKCIQNGDTGKVRLVKDRIEESSEEKPKRKRFTPPTDDEVYKYMLEYTASKGFHKPKRVEAEKFVNHFSSNGWKVGGKATMKDWRRSAANWILRNAPENEIDSAEIESAQRRREDERMRGVAEKSGIEMPSIMGAIKGIVE